MDSPRTTGVALVLALLLALSPVAALPAGPGATAGHSAPPAAPSGVLVPVPPAAPAADGSPPIARPVTEQNGSVGRLVFPSGTQQTATVTTATLDVSAAVAMDDASVRGRYELLWLVEAFGAADTQVERRAVLAESRERLETRIESLERSERRALRRYNHGDITVRAYLRELAAVDAGADGLSPAVAQLHQYSQAVDDSPVSSAEVADLKVRLFGLNGPVRERVKRALAGESDGGRVYVATSDSGVVLSTVVGSEFERRFVREAYLPTERPAGAPDQFFRDGGSQLGDAENRARELYPWAFENELGYSVGLRTGEPFLYLAGVYSVTVDHPQGTAQSGDLVTYIDGGTTEVFRETQTLSLDEVPTSAPQMSTSEGLLLQVNRTYAGGPLEIRVRDAETGEPVAADVSISGSTVGETGPDGRLWTLTPGDPFDVRAERGDATVRIRTTLPSDPSGSQLS